MWKLRRSRLERTKQLQHSRAIGRVVATQPSAAQQTSNKHFSQEESANALSRKPKKAVGEKKGSSASQDVEMPKRKRGRPPLTNKGRSNGVAKFVSHSQPVRSVTDKVRRSVSADHHAPTPTIMSPSVLASANIPHIYEGLGIQMNRFERERPLWISDLSKEEAGEIPGSQVAPEGKTTFDMASQCGQPSRSVCNVGVNTRLTMFQSDSRDDDEEILVPINKHYLFDKQFVTTLAQRISVDCDVLIDAIQYLISEDFWHDFQMPGMNRKKEMEHGLMPRIGQPITQPSQMPQHHAPAILSRARSTGSSQLHGDEADYMYRRTSTPVREIGQGDLNMEFQWNGYNQRPIPGDDGNGNDPAYAVAAAQNYAPIQITDPPHFGDDNDHFGDDNLNMARFIDDEPSSIVGDDMSDKSFVSASTNRTMAGLYDWSIPDFR